MCGVFGVYAPDRDVARLAYFGLFALQHRGQESAGIAVSEHGRLTGLRDLGLVSQVFDEQKLGGLRGQVAIGHNRYSTTGSSQWANAQPLVQHGRARTVALGHNGNLVNVGELREGLRADGVPLGTTSDSELIAALIANDPVPLEEAVANAMRRLEGAYSVTALSEGRLFGFRDVHGFRPPAGIPAYSMIRGGVRLPAPGRQGSAGTRPAARPSRSPVLEPGGIRASRPGSRSPPAP